MPKLVYLHGFLSSPASEKAKVTQAWLSQYQPQWQFICPDLPSRPSHIKESLDALFAQPDMQSDVMLIGSSLGGFWCSYLVEQFGFPAVLINPAVLPQDGFRARVGVELKHYYKDEVCVIDEADIEALRNCDPGAPKNTELYWVMLQKADEVLDYKLAEERFGGCRLTVEEGGSHRFEGYEAWLGEIAEFLSQRTNQN